MKAVIAGILIWAKTLFLNAVFLGIGALLGNSWQAMGIAFFVLIVGFIVTLPLLLIIIPLVDISVKIPYNIPARIAWLTFYLILTVVGFYVLLREVDYWLTGTTIAALLVAVLTTRTSLTKLYKQHDEAMQLQNVLNIINI